MPQADLKYSSDLKIDPVTILKSIETIIKTHDQSSGACKGRAYPTDLYYNTHIYISIALIAKPNRDKAFTDQLMASLESEIKSHINQSCNFSLLIDYVGDTYITNKHEV